ncbi:MAG TPA: ferrous iron transporter B, partial [Bellilinea sp.]|nr:ferrous iron transporter B [Bellilinea sp.]
SGYIARIGFILDRLFRGFGLSGKSALPLLIATGCSVPAVMSTRSIENQSERRLMILVTGFIPCSAKLPVIALIAGTLFGGVWWVAPSAYFAGITAVLISGILLKRSGLFDFDGTPFIFEMPPYRMSTWRDVSLTVWQRVKGFVMKAGTVIFLSSMGLWLLLNYGFVAGKFVAVENIEQSFLASIGGLFAWIFTPLGWGNWQSVVASVTGLLAKENLVSSFAILYGVNEQAGAGSWNVLQSIYTPLTAYSLLIFNLLCVPCMATVAAIRREMNNSRWTTFSLMYQTVYAYTVSFLIFQLGSWAETGSFTGWTAAAVVLTIILIYMLTTRRKKKPRAESVPLATPVKEAR